MIDPVTLLAKLKNIRILVIGDIMLDHYLWGDVHRISPEAPVPVVHAIRDTYTAGGAANAIQGVSTGFTRELDIVGTGYKADVKGQLATFLIGYSHPIEVLLPKGIEMKIDKQTHVVMTGYDKELLGHIASQIRKLRPPDPYKNKGIRYTGEVLKKKAGKTGAGGKT